MEGMCDKGKCGLGEDPRGVRAQGNRDRPRKRSTVKRDEVALKELYHNPDPLVRLIGEANKAEIIIENKKSKRFNRFWSTGLRYFGHFCFQIRFKS